MTVNERRLKIAARAARECKDGMVINLGIGLPTLVADCLAAEVSVLLHSENGFLGIGRQLPPAEADCNVINAGGSPVEILPHGSCFDSAASFAMIRGGHVDATVLGALEVDELGNLANWTVPGKKVTGMGGAMDLVVGAKRVIVAMEHCNKDGSPKIVRRCTLPLTAAAQVDLIITDLAVISVEEDGLHLREIADGQNLADVVAATDAKLIVPNGPIIRY